ncbi:MAG: type I-F CRISPR-associated endoribonuclease Cas6/Csy4 [Zoogloeaceae bacterium]|jgi:CRISPR-associated endonuclease Csy4|nr:type I-F CRISPR-associated endoribonuclease Cas6/Csy4 [Zoogloeaceae bacterium]
MDHYIDFRIRSDPEFSVPQLMSILFTRLHLALVNLNSTDIGVSFPDVVQLEPETDKQKLTVGARLRLHADANRLQVVMQYIRLNDLRDYLQIGNISPIPKQVQYCQVSRVIPKSPPDRLLRRQMRRHPEYHSREDARRAAIQRLVKERNVSEEAASKQVDRVQKCGLPFVSLKSQSTNQPFRLFIKHDLSVSQPRTGSFNSYGLSASATVPWF